MFLFNPQSCHNKLKKTEFKRGDVRVRTRGNMTALAWKDRRDVYVLTWIRHHQKEISVMTATAP
jgi:hypothetical protein